jgi:hypothetical protein
VVSVIELINKREGNFTADDTAIMESFALMTGSVFCPTDLTLLTYEPY